MSMQIATWVTYKLPFKVRTVAGEKPTEEQMRHIKGDVDIENIKHPQMCFMLPNLLAIEEIHLPEMAKQGCHFFEFKDGDLTPVKSICKVSYTAPGLANPESRFVVGSMAELVNVIQQVIAQGNEEIMSNMRQMALAQVGRGGGISLGR